LSAGTVETFREAPFFFEGFRLGGKLAVKERAGDCYQCESGVGS